MLTCKEDIYTITYKLQMREPKYVRTLKEELKNAIFLLGMMQTLQSRIKATVLAYTQPAQEWAC